MRILAVIPARGGSKSVPRKNIALIAGRPLIAYTIDEALKVPAITDLVVSTDDEEIAAMARSNGALVPFLRPAELAKDNTQSAPVLQHCLLHMEKERGIKYDAVLMLQPTTPLRSALHIIEAINLFKPDDCDSVVSVVSVEGYHPFRMKRMIGKYLINYVDQGFEDMRPRQVLPPVFIRNGAIYLTVRQLIAHELRIVGDRCVGMEMSIADSVNIDNRLDFITAEILIRERLLL
jgi:CMP-N,N'-diacetyllegionaminic acid synthase